MTAPETCSLPFDSQATCEDCGQTGAYRFETATLCAECYQKRGACCAEHAGNDLTLRSDDDKPADR